MSTTETSGGLKPGENPYTIKNDDPRVADTVELLQSWGAPTNIVYANLADVGTATNELTVFYENPQRGMAPTSGLMVQNPKNCYNEMKVRGLINPARATAEPSSAADGR